MFLSELQIVSLTQETVVYICFLKKRPSENSEIFGFAVYTVVGLFCWRSWSKKKYSNPFETHLSYLPEKGLKDLNFEGSLSYMHKLAVILYFGFTFNCLICFYLCCSQELKLIYIVIFHVSVRFKYQ